MTTTAQDSVYALAAAPATDGACYIACRSGLYLRDREGQRQPLLHAPNSEQMAVTAVVAAASADVHWLYAAVAGGVFRCVSSVPPWHHAVLPTAAPITALVISPDWQDDGTLFAATLGDGVLRSADHGATWSAWNFGLLDRDVYCLAISPNFAHDHTLIAGTETGLFQSTTGGRAWREFSLACDVPIMACAVAPHSSAEIIVGTEGGGVWQSHDSGRSWCQSLESAETVVGVLVRENGEAMALTVSTLLSRTRADDSWHTLYTVAAGGDGGELTCFQTVQHADGRSCMLLGNTCNAIVWIDTTEKRVI